MCIDLFRSPTDLRGGPVTRDVSPPPDDGSAIRTTMPIGTIQDPEGNILVDDPKWAEAKAGGPAATVLAPQKSMSSMEARRRRLMKRFQYGMLGRGPERAGEKAFGPSKPGGVPQHYKPAFPGGPGIIQPRSPGRERRAKESGGAPQHYKPAFSGGPGIIQPREQDMKRFKTQQTFAGFSPFGLRSVRGR